MYMHATYNIIFLRLRAHNIFYIGNVEWQDKQRVRCLVMWRSPKEWGQLILQWVSIYVCTYVRT